MTFTPTDIVGLMSGLGLLIAAIAAATVKIMEAFRKTERSVASVVRQVEDVSAKADVISGHVNSTASASTAKIDGLEQKVKMLVELLAEKKETAALLAQAVATEKAAGPTMIANGSVVHGTTETSESLKKIDKNTAETAVNTARVQSTVVDVQSQVDALKEKQ